jgi:pimeloyl-ACP methyl ester carboxylesterase
MGLSLASLSARALAVALTAQVLAFGPPSPVRAEPAGLDWQACGSKELRGVDCATLTVPKDYADPSAGTFDLAVARVPATGKPSERIGSLFFNPGGPGVAAVPLAPAVASALPEELRERFDLVVWDPRGVGASAGLDGCTGGSYRLPATGPVDWTSVTAEMRTTQAAANADCQARYPDVVPYIGTRATARDLDALRRAVGDRKLTYWGTSYGTRIGYVYAHDFPDRVRAMLLTSPVEPQGTWASFIHQSALSPDTAISFAFEAYPGLQAAYLRSARALNTRTLTLPSGVTFTRWTMRAILSDLVVSESNYPAMAQFIRDVESALFAAGARKAAALKALAGVSPPLAAIPIRGGAVPFIGCSDYADRLSAGEQDRLARSVLRQAPVLGVGTMQGLFYCDGITVTPDPVPADFTNWHTPMVIMGSTRDALTPYGWAAAMARTFRNSRVVTYVGATHTPFLAGSACIDRIGTRYLLTTDRPRIDVACPNTLARR